MSLLIRLRRLNKEATEGAWVVHGDGLGDEWVVAEEGPRVAVDTTPADARFIVECRNSLPAVLNLIEAALLAEVELNAHGLSTHHEGDEACAVGYVLDKLREAVAVFVSGQEEPK